MGPGTIALILAGIAWAFGKDEMERENTARQHLGDLQKDISAIDTNLMKTDKAIKDARYQLTLTNESIKDREKYRNPITGAIDFSLTAEGQTITDKIDTYQEFLDNWQNSYDTEIMTRTSSDKQELSSLLQNFSNAEVLAADRGASGSMSLIAQQQRQKVVDFAGKDLSLAGGDGLAGTRLNQLKVSLLNSQEQAQRGITTATSALQEYVADEMANYKDLLKNRSDLSDSIVMNTSTIKNDIANLKNYEKDYADTKPNVTNPDSLTRNEYAVDIQKRYSNNQQNVMNDIIDSINNMKYNLDSIFA